MLQSLVGLHVSVQILIVHTVAMLYATGDYVVIERISEGQKVQAEIVHILYQEQIKTLKQQGLWWVVYSMVLNIPSVCVISDS